MIRVMRADPEGVAAEATFRSVGADLEPCTGADGRIGDRAGDTVLRGLRSFGEVPVGGALVTPGGGLPSSFLVHLVVRSLEEPISEDRLTRAFRNGLRQAADWGVRSVVLPPLGTGAGNLDPEVSALVLCRVLAEHRAELPLPERVVIAVATAYEEEAFTRAAERLGLLEEGEG